MKCHLTLPACLFAALLTVALATGSVLFFMLSVLVLLCAIAGAVSVIWASSTLTVSAELSDRTVRRGDALTQYGKGQYLVLLVNTTRENCVVIQKRINDRFIIGRQRSAIRYYVNSVFWTPRFEQTDKSQRQENGHE